MLVSHLSFAQYPTTRVIKGDTVVIMTLKQGKDINEKFVELTDKINNLKDSLLDRRLKIDTLNTETNQLREKKELVEAENKMLNIKLQEKDKSYWREKRTWSMWMFISFIVTVVIGVIK